MEKEEMFNQARDSLLLAVKELNRAMEERLITVPHISGAEFASLSLMQSVLFITANIEAAKHFVDMPKEVLFSNIIDQIASALNIKMPTLTEMTEVFGALREKEQNSKAVH